MYGNQKMETLCGLSGQVKEREFRTITNVVHVLFGISPHYGTGIGRPFRRPFHILSPAVPQASALIRGRSLYCA
jgi:hypothetical protein